jgi:ribosomal protein S18 acetylase RimI-like enzyme
MGDVEVRTLTRSEWQVLRAVRLEALRDAPDAFTSTVEREEHYEPEGWQSRTASSAVAFVEGAPIGLAGWVRFDGADHMELVGMWVHPEHRGTGAAQALVDHVVAATAGEQLMLGVVATNDRARAFYRRAGFVAAGSEPEIGTGRLLLRMRHDPPAAKLRS